MKNSLKIFFLNAVLFFIAFNLFSQNITVDLYRSNTNGLMLLKIKEYEAKNYKYILKVYTQYNLLLKKVLFKENSEIKKWVYKYITSSNILNNEKYYKDKIIREEYFYDSEAHKTKQIDYKDGKKIKTTTYKYNKDGLVEIEKTFNELSKQTIIMKYKYDNNFKIKQIEKDYPDGRIVYWETFFTQKGIVTKEYYTLKLETFTFWYNENGQEFKGEVKKRTEDNTEDTIIKVWETFYTSKGKIDKKEEINFENNKKTITMYNDKMKERRIETYINNKIITIEQYEYNKNNKVTYYELIEDLELTKIHYQYDNEDNLIKTLHYINDNLKKIVTYNNDNSRTEIIFGIKNKNIIVEYDSKGEIISQKIYENK